ncbi:hypothetical protein EYW49_18190 [Siculibacillus lacustris]|uniref:Uncharacterized protein n=1 Tax=Siculibacillus lacustris TaxID=1549641 RepID=A0A4Q9VHD6_9HYPH|nr:hypothetical protein [Siculibacillus lacustris]TBW34517.1 hypothetical protein EYW49_18190 [Siculibacillus lacustris]
MSRAPAGRFDGRAFGWGGQGGGAPAPKPEATGAGAGRRPIRSSQARLAVQGRTAAIERGGNVAAIAKVDCSDGETETFDGCMGTTDAEFRRRSRQGFEGALETDCGRIS